MQDPATGLYYLRARYYDPVAGRFLSKDPVAGLLNDPQTLNPYVYTVNNPVNYVDPSGEFWLPVFVGAGVNVAADYFVTTIIEGKDYSLERAFEAASTGGLSSLAGIGILKLFGGQGIGRFMTRLLASGLVNAGVNTLQRKWLGECTTSQDLYWDLIFGAGGSVFNDFIDWAIKPSLFSVNKYYVPELGNLRFWGIPISDNAVKRLRVAFSVGLRFYRELPTGLRVKHSFLRAFVLGMSDSSPLQAVSQWLQ
jgi:RHS repeat-associated protein